VILAKATGIRPRFQFEPTAPEFRAIVRQGLGFLAAAAAAQASMAYMRRLATLDGVGTNAAITYALSIVSPIALLLGKPLSLTLGPTYAQTIARGDRRAAGAIVVKSVAACCACGAAVACIVNCFSGRIIAFLYGGGGFDAAAVRLTSGLFDAFIWSLPCAGVIWVIQTPMLATRNASLSGLLLAMGSAAHIFLSAAFFPRFGKDGLAWAFVIALATQAASGVLLVYRDLRRPALEAPPRVLQRGSVGRRRAHVSSGERA
jgi:peptidoglycan biosynthesis protein MviN/MurJ (putative lipid II flippase)